MIRYIMSKEWILDTSQIFGELVQTDNLKQGYVVGYQGDGQNLIFLLQSTKSGRLIQEEAKNCQFMEKS